MLLFLLLGLMNLILHLFIAKLDVQLDEIVHGPHRPELFLSLFRGLGPESFAHRLEPNLALKHEGREDDGAQFFVSLHELLEGDELVRVVVLVEHFHEPFRLSLGVLSVPVRMDHPYHLEHLVDGELSRPVLVVQVERKLDKRLMSEGAEVPKRDEKLSIRQGPVASCNGKVRSEQGRKI